MKVAVWDTYASRDDGKIMHFDILAPVEVKNPQIIFGYGLQYLRTKGQEKSTLTSKECQFCHVERVRPEWEADILEKGFHIIEMDGCN